MLASITQYTEDLNISSKYKNTQQVDVESCIMEKIKEEKS